MRLHPGDVIRVEPNVKHWHGAVPDQWFSHIGLTLGDTRRTPPLEALTEEEYLSCEKD